MLLTQCVGLAMIIENIIEESDDLKISDLL